MNAEKLKASIKIIPKPLFDTLDNLDGTTISRCVLAYLQNLPIPEAETEYRISMTFLQSYAGSVDTFNSYRREVERFLHWSWAIAQKSIKKLDRNDVRNYIEFSRNPPLGWITTKNVARFVIKDGERVHNSEWRPFVAKISKAQRKQGDSPDKHDYLLGNKAIAALLAILSTYFTFLQQECYVEVNPVQLVRQKNQYIQRQQTYKITRRLSHLQWRCAIEITEEMANNNSAYERHLFLLSIFYLLGLRISEVAETRRRTPVMGDFAPDKNSRWWFTTVGKGNKLRDVAVPDAMLDALKRYRLQRNLTSLPVRGEMTPLVAKDRGRGNLGTRQVRNLVQECFDWAIANLRRAGKADEAQDLEAATVHWLRHTAISADILHRPREHVRDDAGHESAVITDHYIDADRAARHESAKNKKLKPEDL